MRNADAKYLRAAEETTHVNGDFRLRIMPLVSSLKSARDHIAQFEKDRIEEIVED